VTTETGVLDPKLLGFHMPGPSIYSYTIKKHNEGRERRFITQLRTCCGRDRVSMQLILSHLQNIDMSNRFK
jgi:hypothetical protein